jgi:hypothetical protein
MKDASPLPVRTTAAWLACLAVAVGCGSSTSASPPRDASAGASGDGSSPATPQGNGDASPLAPSEAGTTPSTCAPTIPTVPWTSPYAAWSRGIPTDPSFFPIAVWLQGSWHATELAGLGINIYVGNNAGTDSLAASDLATLKAQGLHAIIGQDSVGLANIDDTTIVGWWMDPDEPDNAQSNGMGGYGPPVNPSTLVTKYNAFKKADPTRPIYLGLGQGVAYANYEGRGNSPPPESDYVPASDIVSFDIYPYNNCSGDPNDKVTCGQFWLNASGVDNLQSWAKRNQVAWSDFETTVIGAGTSDGPTPDQTALEVWLALIHGAGGVEYFIDSWQPKFREDAIFADPAMAAAVTALNQEIKSLAPELNSASLPNLVTVTISNGSTPIDMMVKAHGTSLYVFAAISRAGAAMGSFTVNGMTGSGIASVVGENRTIDVASGKFSDMFAATSHPDAGGDLVGAHVYQIDLSKVTCP